MKKILKYTLVLISIISLTFIFSGRAYAKTCSEYSYDNCPKDSNCIKDPELKKCYTCDEVNKNHPWELPTNASDIFFLNMMIDTGKLMTTINGNKKLCATNSKCMWRGIKVAFIEAGACETRPKKTTTDVDIIVNEKTKFKCSDVKHLTSIWMFLRIVSPFLVVLFGSLDFFKAMASSDEKKMKESRGKFIKRVIAFFLLILLPFMIQFIFERIGTNGSQNMCLIKCITTNNTSSKEGCD